MSAPASFDLSQLPREWAPAGEWVSAQELEAELARELSLEHALYGVPAVAIAVRQHLKDVIYWLPETSEWACVHLTRNVESDPRWPAAVVAREWNELIDETFGD